MSELTITVAESALRGHPTVFVQRGDETHIECPYGMDVTLFSHTSPARALVLWTMHLPKGTLHGTEVPQ